MISHEAILAVLETRFDHVSARVVLGEALRVAGLGSSKKVYSPEEVRSLSNAVAGVATRVESVTAALNDLAGPAAPVPPQPQGPVETEPAPAPEEPPAEAPVEEPPAAASGEEQTETEPAAKKKKKK